MGGDSDVPYTFLPNKTISKTYSIIISKPRDTLTGFFWCMGPTPENCDRDRENPDSECMQRSNFEHKQSKFGISHINNFAWNSQSSQKQKKKAGVLEVYIHTNPWDPFLSVAKSVPRMSSFLSKIYKNACSDYWWSSKPAGVMSERDRTGADTS